MPAAAKAVQTLEKALAPGEVAQRTKDNEPKEEHTASKKAKNSEPAVDWDPKDAAVVQYSDDAWAVAYNDAATPTPNLYFRRSLGGGRSPVLA